MSTSSSSLQVLFDMARAYTTISRTMDGRIGGGLGFNDIMILHYLSKAEGEKMRRVDLAEKIGLTPSGVTRLLAPMEKIGLIRREATEHDARVSLVSLAPGGRTLLSERIEGAEIMADDFLPSGTASRLASALAGIGTTTY